MKVTKRIKKTISLIAQWSAFLTVILLVIVFIGGEDLIGDKGHVWFIMAVILIITIVITIVTTILSFLFEKRYHPK